MEESALAKITKGVLPLIREMVKEEVKNLTSGGTDKAKSELKIPFRNNFEIVLFMNRPALMDGLRERIERLEEGPPDQFAARLAELVFTENYIATHEFSSDFFPCCNGCEGGAGNSSSESVPVPFLNWLVGVVGERLGPNWAESWRVCCELRHAFCGPKDRGESAAGRLIKLDGDLRRGESRALRGN